MNKIPKEEYKKNNWISPDELSLNFYFDGGTIGIKCFGMYKGEYISKNGKYGDIITIDKSLQTAWSEGAEAYHKWYVGWKHKGGLLIDDLEFKQEIIRKLKDKIEFMNSLLYGYLIPSSYNNK